VEKSMLCCETFFKGSEEKEFLAVNEELKILTTIGRSKVHMERRWQEVVKDLNSGLVLFSSFQQIFCFFTSF
jgi:hypothetical protein